MSQIFIYDIVILIVCKALNLCFTRVSFILISGYIFENLPAGTFNDIVRLFLSLELTLTFPIVFKPASDVMEEIWYNFLMVSFVSVYSAFA